jgi:DNA-binding transcriptional LysR family regulator
LKSKHVIRSIRLVDLAGFDLNLLRVFAALMRERSVTRAGDQIGLSQPAVSAALNRLRYLLDDHLFVRRGNIMVPTPRAEDLAVPVQDALSSLEAALRGRRDFDPATALRTYTLLGSDYFSMLLMPKLAEWAVANAPGIRFRLLDSGWVDVGRSLQEDSVDIVLEGPLELPDWVSRQVLFQSEFAIVARANDPRLRGVSVDEPFPLELFCELPHALRTIEGGMTAHTDAMLAEHGRARRVVIAIPHFQGVLLAAAEAGVIAAVPRTFAEAYAPPLGLALFQPPMPMPSPDIQMYWHTRHDQNPAHRWLRERVTALLS